MSLININDYSVPDILLIEDNETPIMLDILLESILNIKLEYPDAGGGAIILNVGLYVKTEFTIPFFNIKLPWFDEVLFAGAVLYIVPFFTIMLSPNH
jgi:hypothetical protein